MHVEDEAARLTRIPEVARRRAVSRHEPEGTSRHATSVSAGHGPDSDSWLADRRGDVNDGKARGIGCPREPVRLAVVVDVERNGRDPFVQDGELPAGVIQWGAPGRGEGGPDRRPSRRPAVGTRTEDVDEPDQARHLTGCRVDTDDVLRIGDRVNGPACRSTRSGRRTGPRGRCSLSSSRPDAWRPRDRRKNSTSPHACPEGVTASGRTLSGSPRHRSTAPGSSRSWRRSVSGDPITARVRMTSAAAMMATAIRYRELLDNRVRVHRSDPRAPSRTSRGRKSGPSGKRGEHRPSRQRVRCSARSCASSCPSNVVRSGISQLHAQSVEQTGEARSRAGGSPARRSRELRRVEPGQVAEGEQGPVLRREATQGIPDIQQLDTAGGVARNRADRRPRSRSRGPHAFGARQPGGALHSRRLP